MYGQCNKEQHNNLLINCSFVGSLRKFEVKFDLPGKTFILSWIMLERARPKCLLTTHAVPQPNFRLRGNHKSHNTQRFLPASISAWSDSWHTHTHTHTHRLPWLSNFMALLNPSGKIANSTWIRADSQYTSPFHSVAERYRSVKSSHM